MAGGVKDGLSAVRVGLCCGDGCRGKLEDVVLYAVSAHRWRCAACYRREVGQFHWRTPPETVRAIVEAEARAAGTIPPKGETNG